MSTTANEVWQLLGELVESQKETDRRMQETDRRMQETDRRMQETDRQMQETDRRLQETDRLVKEVSKQIGNLGGRWGRFVENMVAPACETLFVERGIPVHLVAQRVKGRRLGETLEIDILVVNQEQAMVVEVKSSLGVEDIKAFTQDLQRFRSFFPEYGDKRLYGAVAGIELEAGADRFAYRQGLFVLAQSGESVTILNDGTFEPRAW